MLGNEQKPDLCMRSHLVYLFSDYSLLLLSSESVIVEANVLLEELEVILNSKTEP